MARGSVIAQSLSGICRSHVAQTDTLRNSFSLTGFWLTRRGLHSTPCASNLASSAVRDANEELNEVFGAQPDHAALDTAKSGAAPSTSHGAHEEVQRLTHVDSQGQPAMVDVGDKAVTKRIAVASAVVHLGAVAYNLVASNSIKKGNVLETAKCAGIMAAKQTASLIPLCHNLNLTMVSVNTELRDSSDELKITARVESRSGTGVEMEALVAASIAGLTVYDMVKGVNPNVRMTRVQLEHKSGGKSGVYRRPLYPPRAENAKRGPGEKHSSVDMAESDEGS